MVGLLALGLAGCAGSGPSEREAYRAAVTADSLRFVDPANRAAAPRGLVYERAACTRVVVSLPAGTLVRHRRGGGPDTVRFAVPADTLRALLAAADRADAWALPADFHDGLRLDGGPEAVRAFVSVERRVRVDLRDGPRRAVVRWGGWNGTAVAPLTADGARLEALAARIEAAVGLDGRLAALPGLPYVCL